MREQNIIEPTNDNLINIVIGTTSLNRPVLHTDIFTEWIKWLDQIDKKKYKLVWFINIDIIENLDVTYEETTNNYNKLLSNFTNAVNGGGILRNYDDPIINYNLHEL